MQVKENKENREVSLVGLESKHYLLGKYGFSLPAINNFSVIKIVSSTEIGNIKITSNNKPNYLAYNKNAILSGKVYLDFARKAENNLLFLGNNVQIENGEFNFFGTNGTVIIGNNNAHYHSTKTRTWSDKDLIFIGANTTSNGLNLSSKSSNIIIGDDCMIANDVWIRNSDEHAIFALDTLKTINLSGEVIVYPHVWIGQNVLILKNTTVGSGSIIGAKSLVIKVVPSFSIVGGNPTKVLKSNVSWDRHHSKIQDTTLQEINKYKSYNY